MSKAAIQWDTWVEQRAIITPTKLVRSTIISPMLKQSRISSSEKNEWKNVQRLKKNTSPRNLSLPSRKLTCKRFAIFVLSSSQQSPSMTRSLSWTIESRISMDACLTMICSCLETHKPSAVRTSRMNSTQFRTMDFVAQNMSSWVRITCKSGINLSIPRMFSVYPNFISASSAYAIRSASLV